MAIKQLNPYLMFNGTAAQAIALYERALGAKTENLSRFGDAPGHGIATRARGPRDARARARRSWHHHGE